MANNQENKKLVIERIFEASREKVWEAWTNPEMMKKWWGPKDFSAPFIQIDLRVGGKYLFCMRGAATPGGAEQDFWSTGVYKEIIKPEKLVMTDSFSDEKGNAIPASQYGMAGDWPLELLVTVLFKEQGNKTKITLEHKGMPADQNRELARQGWNQSFDKLAEILK